jgi:GntR family transcriptional regulator
MYLTIDLESKASIYEQVSNGIKERIARGELKEGAMLPPVRQLAGDLGVNLNTIATAYRQLQSEGLVTVKHGSGVVVNSRTLGRNATGSSDGELRAPLRTALTQLVLAGWTRGRILSLVTAELRDMLKGAR